MPIYDIKIAGEYTIDSRLIIAPKQGTWRRDSQLTHMSQSPGEKVLSSFAQHLQQKLKSNEKPYLTMEEVMHIASEYVSQKGDRVLSEVKQEIHKIEESLQESCKQLEHKLQVQRGNKYHAQGLLHLDADIGEELGPAISRTQNPDDATANLHIVLGGMKYTIDISPNTTLGDVRNRINNALKSIQIDNDFELLAPDGSHLLQDKDSEILIDLGFLSESEVKLVIKHNPELLLADELKELLIEIGKLRGWESLDDAVARDGDIEETTAYYQLDVVVDELKSIVNNQRAAAKAAGEAFIDLVDNSTFDEDIKVIIDKAEDKIKKRFKE